MFFAVLNFAQNPPSNSTEPQGSSGSPDLLEVSTEQRLLRNLSRFDPTVRPVYHHTSTVTVSLALKIAQLDYLNAKRQVLGLNGWLSVTWTSEFHTWDSEEFDGLESIVLPPSQVWLPAFTLDNGASDVVYEEAHYKWFRVHVYNDGFTEWEPGGTFESSCAIDVTFYPFDDQTCHVKFANWVYTGSQVNLTYSPEALNEMLETYTLNGEWDIVQIWVTREDYYYMCCPEPYPEVTFYLHLRRKTLFYVMNLILPSTMLSLLVVLVYLLPSDCGEKISMGVTLLLSFAVFILMISENVPNTSTAVPLIAIYLILLMGLTAITIALTVLILSLHHRGDATPPPPWLTALVFRGIQPLICGGRGRVALPLMRYREDLPSGGGQSKPEANGVIYNTSESYRYDFRLSSTSVSADDEQQMVPPTERFTDDAAEEVSVTSPRREQNHARWRDIAAILDTFFFWSFFITTIVASLIVLFVVPLFKPVPEKV